MEKDRFAIGEAAEYLNVSVDTLRRWDASGKLKALRSLGGHRYYPKEQLQRFVSDIESVARVWAESPVAPELSLEQYCRTHDIFKACLDSMSTILSQSNRVGKDIVSLIDAIVGEVGNNSFDHNFGNWPDVPGIFFSYNMDKRIIVLADRGLGIRATLLRVRPGLQDDTEALRVAFTERVSGRSPEQRGNGLKFVYNVASKYPVSISLQSGMAVANVSKGDSQLKIGLASRNIRGTSAKILY
jgi:excisionase family DNA binding protein